MWFYNSSESFEMITANELITLLYTLIVLLYSILYYIEI